VRAGPLLGAVTMRTVILLIALVTAALASDCPPAPVNRQQALNGFQKLSNAAQDAFRNNDYTGAAAKFRQALCLAPDSAYAYHGLGLALAAAAQFDQARTALEQADRLSPHDFTILLSLAQVQASTGNFELAGRTLEAAAGASVSTQDRNAMAQLHGQLGRSLIQQGKLDLALAQLLRARNAGLDDPPTLLMLATLENNLGAYSDAIRDTAAVDSSPQAAAAQRAAAAAIGGLAQKNQKKNDEAIEFLNRSIRLAPGETAYLALAEIYEMKEQTSEAAKLLEQAATAFPGSPRIALALGRNLVNAGQNRRAVDVLTAITRQAPAEVDAWHWLAQAESSLGEFKKATGALEQLSRRQPAYPMIDTMIAQSLLKWEPPAYARALQFLGRAARISPTDPDIYYLRGKIYASMGRYAEAVQPLLRAIELGPAIPASYYQLGQVFQKLGREAEAKRQFDTVKYLKSAAP
jgi:tetratricopeptide (TPR) repeat protein